MIVFRGVSGQFAHSQRGAGAVAAARGGAGPGRGGGVHDPPAVLARLRPL